MVDRSIVRPSFFFLFQVLSPSPLFRHCPRPAPPSWLAEVQGPLERLDLEHPRPLAAAPRFKGLEVELGCHLVGGVHLEVEVLLVAVFLEAVVALDLVEVVHLVVVEEVHLVVEEVHLVVVVLVEEMEMGKNVSNSKK